MEIQVLHDLQAAKILELQAKLENQESQPDSTDTRENGLEQLLLDNELSPAVVQMCHREAFRDVENLPYLRSTPTSALPQLCSHPVSTCNPPKLKTAADVIGNNQKLLQTTSKAGWLAVKLARESYFGEEVMKVSTVSSLPREKFRDKGMVVWSVLF